jgi:hypothetical protein
MPRVTVKIDREHTRRLLRGETVRIVVPEGLETMGLRLDVPDGNKPDGDSIAKILDVFFNGRKA